MKIRKALQTVGKGIMWAVLPVYAWKKIVATKESLVRIREMAHRGRTIRDPEAMSELERKRYELEQEGREVVLGMEEHERFAYMASALGWTEDTIREKMKVFARAHAIRYCLLVFTVILTAGLTYRYGIRPLIYGSAASMYLTTACVKTACFYTQMEERALWSLVQVVKRPRFWIWRRALWFLE